jgi:transcriptional regulator with XRE-family HTH domain
MTEVTTMHVGEWLTSARERAFLTIPELAEASGIHPSTIRGIENDTHGIVPHLRTVSKLAAVLNCEPSDISPQIVAPARLRSTSEWPPPELTAPTYEAVCAYRAAGDSIGAAELLGVVQDTVRKRLNAAGCAARPRGGSRSDGIMSLAQWARDEQITVRDALDDFARGRVPGAGREVLYDDPILQFRNVVRKGSRDAQMRIPV